MKVKKGGFKEQLSGIAAKDPDFYEFLQQEEPDLLNFSDDEVSDDAIGGKDHFVGDADVDEKSDDESEHEVLQSGKSLKVEIQVDRSSGLKLIDANLLNFLAKVLSNPNEHRPALSKTVQIAIDCFTSYINRAGQKSSKLTSKFIAKRESEFDEIVHICFKYLGRCLLVLLNPTLSNKYAGNKFKKSMKVDKGTNGSSRTNLTTFKNWRKFGTMAKSYLSVINMFIVELQNSEVIVPAVRAVVDLVDIYLHFPKLCKNLVKVLVQFWSRKIEEVRCMSFVALCKIVRFASTTFPEVYKAMYKSYIANCKQITTETLPLISFMQKSFTEITLLNETVAYQYAFLYIRQFAIHLRNATIAKRKDLVQTVYNWQFVQGLYLWTNVVCQGTKNGTTSKYQWFSEVGFPLCEIINILRKVFISNKYLPLRLHCVKMLLQIQSSCNVFIPTLAICVELLNELAEIDENKPETGKGATRMVDIEELLRLSKSQINDAGYRHKLAEELYKRAMESVELLKTNIGFVDLIVPIEHNIQKFLKKCKNKDHVSLFKSFKHKLLKEVKEVGKLTLL